jgi:hypothetical protein
MTPFTFHKLDKEFSAFPITKASDTPTDDEIAQAASALGVAFHDDYVAFLRRYGGAMGFTRCSARLPRYGKAVIQAT